MSYNDCRFEQVSPLEHVKCVTYSVICNGDVVGRCFVDRECQEAFFHPVDFPQMVISGCNQDDAVRTYFEYMSGVKSR